MRGAEVQGASAVWCRGFVAGLIGAASALAAGCAQIEHAVPFTAGAGQQTYWTTSEPEVVPPPAAPAPWPKPAVRQAQPCDKPEKCLDRLKLLVEGPDRAWIKHPEDPAALANGVRLFAYGALKKRLSCEELAAALLEIDNANKAYGGSVPGVGAKRLVAARALGDRIGKELHAEASARCTA